MEVADEPSGKRQLCGVLLVASARFDSKPIFDFVDAVANRVSNEEPFGGSPEPPEQAGQVKGVVAVKVAPVDVLLCIKGHLASLSHPQVNVPIQLVRLRQSASRRNVDSHSSSRLSARTFLLTWDCSFSSWTARLSSLSTAAFTMPSAIDSAYI